jgi:hypothetical protein
MSRSWIADRESWYRFEEAAPARRSGRPANVSREWSERLSAKEVRRNSTKTSIYEHVVAHVPADGPGLSPGGNLLPDDPRGEEDIIRFAPGLRDRILDPGTALSAEQMASSLMPPFVEAASASARGEPYVVLYRQLVAIEQLGFLDPFIRRVVASRLPRRKVRSVALRLVMESTDRLPVKVGIALLGVCARRQDEGTLLTIARHPEFTDYAGMALTNAFGSRDDVLWELAKVTEGWGRIALVQQLAKTQRSEIKAWILRETGRDHMLLRGASLVAAEAGDLRKELSAEEVDDDLCVAAGAILQTLIENRPTEARDSIDDYAEGQAAIGLFLSHLRHRPEDLQTIQPLLTIIDYLELRGGVDWNISPEFRDKLLKKVAGRPLAGWTEGERARAATLARWVLRRPGWRRAIEDGLRSSDRWTFYLAVRAAMRLGDNVAPVLLERLRRDPYADEITWGDAVRTADEAGFDDLLEVAFTRLSEHRPYEGWAFPGWLRAIVEGLERFPGKGWPLIREGLTSGVMMERRFGLNGVWAFGGKPWPREAVALVAALARADPDEYNREKAAELLEDQGYPGRASTP